MLFTSLWALCGLQHYVTLILRFFGINWIVWVCTAVRSTLSAVLFMYLMAHKSAISQLLIWVTVYKAGFVSWWELGHPLISSSGHSFLSLLWIRLNVDSLIYIWCLCWINSQCNKNVSALTLVSLFWAMFWSEKNIFRPLQCTYGGLHVNCCSKTYCRA